MGTKINRKGLKRAVVRFSGVGGGGGSGVAKKDAHKPNAAFWCFEVLGPVVPKQRPRVGRGGRVYTPRETQDYEAAVARAAIAAGVCRLEGAVSLTLEITPPDNKRRDIDNCAKTIMDGLNGVAYEDDSQVRLLVVSMGAWSEDGSRVVVVARRMP